MARNNDLLMIIGLTAMVALTALFVVLTTPGAPEFTPLIEDDPRDLTHVDPTPPVEIPPAPPELEFIESVAGKGELEPVETQPDLTEQWTPGEICEAFRGTAEIFEATPEEIGMPEHLANALKPGDGLFGVSSNGRAVVKGWADLDDDARARGLEAIEEIAGEQIVVMRYVEIAVESGDYESFGSHRAAIHGAEISKYAHPKAYRRADGTGVVVDMAPLYECEAWKSIVAERPNPAELGYVNPPPLAVILRPEI